MQRLSLVSFLLSATLIFSGCSDDDGGNGGGDGKKGGGKALVVNSKPGLGPMVVLGDSLAFGDGAVSSTAKVPEKCLADAFGQQVTNIAVPGLTSAEILLKVPQATAGQPTLIFVSSAGNDAIMNYYQPGSYAASKTMNEMTQMFDALTSSKALIVYLGLQPPLPGSERLPEVSKLAESKGVLVVDGMQGLWNNASMMADQFHPNDAGYAKMCDKILAALKGHYP